MSFTDFRPEGPLRTRAQVMQIIIQVANELNMPDKRGACIVAGITVSQEAGANRNGVREFWCPANHADEESFGFAHDSESDDGRSVGYFQQQKSSTGAEWWGPTATEMDLHSAATTFMTRLRKAGYDASMVQRANDSAQTVQGSGFPNAYGQWFDAINRLYDSVVSGPVQEVPISNRPDFNEFPIWSPSNQSRGGTKVDAIFLHTQEGGGGDSAAEDLAKYLGNPVNQVSYHYACSQASDGGVTVVDVVDTDFASWSVLSANNRSINYCFAGSRAAWTRDEWLKQSKAIDVVAYLIVQDCAKYSIPLNVIPPPYVGRIPGVSDHAYVTKILGDGTHTDVGPNFPWDVLSASITKYASGDVVTPPVVVPPVVVPPVVKVWPKDYSDRELLEYIVGQLGTGDPLWPSIGKDAKGQPYTLRDAVGALVSKAA